MTSRIIPALLASCLAASPTSSMAQSAMGSFGAADDVVSVELLDGWREADGRHIAAIRMTLAEGWKTYWRAPGDGGLPTQLQWHLSDNLENLQILWPRPMVFDEEGMRSLGYMNEVVLPIELTPEESGDIGFFARLNFGVCKEVCVPVSVQMRRTFDAEIASHVAPIQTAMVAAPAPAHQADVRAVDCRLDPIENGHQLSVSLHTSLKGASAAMVIETPDPEIWVGRTDLTWDGDHWQGITRLHDHRSPAAVVDPEDIRITLLTETGAIDIQGCDTP